MLAGLSPAERYPRCYPWSQRRQVKVAKYLKTLNGPVAQPDRAAVS
jgi:hypothetical protein